MRAIPTFLDTASKRWLAGLGAVFLATVVMLARAFFSAAFPSAETAITAEPRAPHPTEQVTARAEPTWESLQVNHEAEQKQPDSRVSPFAAQDAAEARDNPVIIQQRVHQQAEYLRKQIANGTLPESLGHLTKEQVDEMEKKGLMIE